MEFAERFACAWIGPWRQGEFAPLLRQLDPAARRPGYATCDDCLAGHDAADAPPEVVLVAQPLPDGSLSAQLQRLAAATPLTRIVLVAGAWCEGERRTGRPPDGALRVYWHELLPWAAAVVATARAGAAPPWSRPVCDLAADAWRGLAAAAPWHAGPLPAAPWVAVDTDDYASYETLEAVLHSCGYAAQWRPRGRPRLWERAGDAPCCAGLWDGGQLAPREQTALRDFVDRLRPQGAGVAAIVDFPRGEHADMMVATGATALLGKPYRREAVAWALRRRLAAG
jgi:hypothetical protein